MIEINNLTKFNIDRKLFTGVAKKVLLGENRLRENVSIAFVAKSEMQKLNKKFRGKDNPTDVLSFSAQGGPAWGGEHRDIFGEVVICPEVVKEKKETIEKVLIHGILHLCGYDHEKSEKEAEKMEERENHYLSIL